MLISWWQHIYSILVVVRVAHILAFPAYMLVALLLSLLLLVCSQFSAWSVICECDWMECVTVQQVSYFLCSLRVVMGPLHTHTHIIRIAFSRISIMMLFVVCVCTVSEQSIQFNLTPRLLHSPVIHHFPSHSPTERTICELSFSFVIVTAYLDKVYWLHSAGTCNLRCNGNKNVAFSSYPPSGCWSSGDVSSLALNILFVWFLLLFPLFFHFFPRFSLFFPSFSSSPSNSHSFLFSFLLFSLSATFLLSMPPLCIAVHLSSTSHDALVPVHPIHFIFTLD